jgi:hypothetical protein
MTNTTERVDTWDMPLVHRVFRREFHLLPALVRAVPEGNTARAGVVGAHLESLAAGLHHHHTAEDELLWPLLLTRARMHTELIIRMTVQHARLHEPLERIAELCPHWRATARAGDRDELANVIAEASAALDEHLADEEQEILPIASEHVTQAEWDALGERGRELLPKGKMALVFLGSVFDEATPAERSRFLGELPGAARVVWRLFGGRVYRNYRNELLHGR